MTQKHRVRSYKARSLLAAGAATALLGTAGVSVAANKGPAKITKSELPVQGLPMHPPKPPKKHHHKKGHGSTRPFTGTAVWPGK